MHGANREACVLVGEGIAAEVLAALGGRDNILTNTVCMTRLRVTLKDPGIVDYSGLANIKKVLGTATRGNNGLEVVFGPRVIDEVYHDFVRLSGRAAGSDALFPMSRPASNMRLQINQIRASSPPETDAPQEEPAPEDDSPLIDEQEMSVLEGIFGDVEEQDDEQGPKADEPGEYKLLVINGPNLNMLGIREPDLYGKQDYPAMLQLCKDAAQEAGFACCDCYQSNHEGDLVDKIQDAYEVYDGIVINPGAYTHTSIALLDALKAVGIPTVEVHISRVDEREDFRQVSYVRLACFETVMGLGIEGYRKAIHDLAAYLNHN